MLTLDVGGCSVAYRAAGSGQTVILLHSSASSGAQWRSIGERLAQHYHVVTPDLFGYGQTGRWLGSGALTLGEEAAIVEGLAQHVERPIHLVGHSYGGAVALRTALRGRVALDSLCLIEPVAFHLLRGGGAACKSSLAEIERLSDRVATGVLSGDYRGAMADFVDYWGAPGTWASLERRQQQAIAETAPQVALNFSSALGAPERPSDCAKLQVSTLMLRGGRSPTPVRRISDLLANTIPFARQQAVVTAGHMLPLTHPDIAAKLMMEHLERSTTGPRQVA